MHLLTKNKAKQRKAVMGARKREIDKQYEGDREAEKQRKTERKREGLCVVVHNCP